MINHSIYYDSKSALLLYYNSSHYAQSGDAQCKYVWNYGNAPSILAAATNNECNKQPARIFTDTGCKTRIRIYREHCLLTPQRQS